MADSYSELDPTQRRTADEALRRLGILTETPQSRTSRTFDALGSAASAAAGAMGNNRVEGALAEEAANQTRQSNFRDQVTQREQDRRAGQDQAWRMMQQAAYIDGGGRPYTAPVVNGHALPTYGIGPTSPTEWERQNASAAGSEAQNRLAHRDSLTPVVTDPGTFKIPKSSFWEKLLGIAGGAAKVAAPFLP